MERNEIVLAALAPANGAAHRPVQVQKLLFLIDQNVASSLGGPFFEFKPYDYGPFDKAVYEVLWGLSESGLVEIVPENTWRDYRLTGEGQKQGDALLREMAVPIQNYIREISQFIRKLSFSQLVAAVYKAYPEMRVNSIFHDQL